MFQVGQIGQIGEALLIDRCTADIELLESVKCGQRRQAHIRDLRIAEAEVFEVRQRCYVLQPTVADLCGTEELRQFRASGQIHKPFARHVCPRNKGTQSSKPLQVHHPLVANGRVFETQEL